MLFFHQPNIFIISIVLTFSTKPNVTEMLSQNVDFSVLETFFVLLVLPSKKGYLTTILPPTHHCALQFLSNTIKTRPYTQHTSLLESQKNNWFPSDQPFDDSFDLFDFREDLAWFEIVDVMSHVQWETQAAVKG